MKRREWSGPGRAACLTGASVLAALSLLPSPARAAIESISIEPAFPSCTDEVTIQVAGWFPNGCWRVTGTSSTRVGNVFEFEIEAREGPGSFCSDELVEYDALHEAGRLEPGAYTVTAEERLEQGPFPGGPPGDFQTGGFEVECCAPDRRGPGYWHRQCLGIGLVPWDRQRRGPHFPTEPAFGELVAAVDAILLEEIGVPSACVGGMHADPPWDPCERAIRQYTALLFDVESGRLQRSCAVDLQALGCESGKVGTLIDELAERIRAGDAAGCRVASVCAVATHGRAALRKDSAILSPDER